MELHLQSNISVLHTIWSLHYQRIVSALCPFTSNLPTTPATMWNLARPPPWPNKSTPSVNSLQEQQEHNYHSSPPRHTTKTKNHNDRKANGIYKNQNDRNITQKIQNDDLIINYYSSLPATRTWHDSLPPDTCTNPKYLKPPLSIYHRKSTYPNKNFHKINNLPPTRNKSRPYQLPTNTRTTPFSCPSFKALIRRAKRQKLCNYKTGKIIFRFSRPTRQFSTLSVISELPILPSSIPLPSVSHAPQCTIPHESSKSTPPPAKITQQTSIPPHTPTKKASHTLSYLPARLLPTASQFRTSIYSHLRLPILHRRSPTFNASNPVCSLSFISLIPYQHPALRHLLLYEGKLKYFD